MSKISLASTLLALSLPCAGAFAQAAAFSPSLPDGSKVLFSCGASPARSGLLFAPEANLNKDRQRYGMALRDMATNTESFVYVTKDRAAARAQVQDYCNGLYAPPHPKPFFTSKIS